MYLPRKVILLKSDIKIVWKREWTQILLSNFVNFPDYFYFAQANIYADLEILTK